jgi:membrane protein
LAPPLDARVTWRTLSSRTVQETITDNCLGLSAQLAYYFFLSVFPALLVVVALTSFFPRNLLETILSWFSSFTPPDVLKIVRAQIQLVMTTSGHSGLLTFGALGALWSASSAMNATIDTLNRAYGIKEARPWWRVQALAVVLTIIMSVFVLVAFTLVVAGPEIAEQFAARHGLGPLFEWAWKVLQWPVVFLLISEAFGFVYYLAPDAEQRWLWILPGAHLATALWLLISLGFRFYVTHFGQFNRMYGTIGGVIVMLLWFYLSGLVLLIGAEFNSEIEHASPYGKAEGEKVPGEHRGWLFRSRWHTGIGETPEPSKRT